MTSKDYRQQVLLSTRKAVGQMLRAKREANGFTRYNVAYAMGVGDRTVRGWEQGRRLPSAKNMRKLARLLGITPEEWARAGKRN